MERTPMSKQVLLIEDDDALRHSLAQALSLEDIKVFQATNFHQARRTVRANFKGIILSDIRMPGKDGFDVLQFAQDVDAELPVILLTGEGDVPMAMKAMRKGAYDFLEKPCQIDYLIGVINRALDQRKLVLRNRKIERDLQRNDIAAINFPGSSKASKDLRKSLRLVGENDAPVHLFGTKGSGRRIAAHTIHQLSEDTFDFTPINISNEDHTPFEILETASKQTTVLFKGLENADNAYQGKILNLIEHCPHIRVVTSSGLNTASLHEQKFNADLCARLGQVEILVPSFAQRKEDLPIIFESLVRQAVRNISLDMPPIPKEVYAQVMAREWKTNFLELRSFANAFALGRKPDGGDQQIPSLTEQIDSFEKLVLSEALKKHNGQAAAAAEELSLPRKTFYDRIKRHDLKPKDFVQAEG
jgi:two-component system C4-dicarboxylate transport response regulator DctD